MYGVTDRIYNGNQNESRGGDTRKVQECARVQERFQLRVRCPGLRQRFRKFPTVAKRPRAVQLQIYLT